MSPDAQAVLAYWFGTAGDDAEVADAQSSLWWDHHPAVDAEIRERFSALRAQAVSGALQDWTGTPHGRLALIILVDQFSRNIYRDNRRAYADDARARAWCQEGLARSDDLTLRIIERVFFYLPLEHSENIDDQEHAVKLFEALAGGAAPAHRKRLADFAGYARRHRDIVARFGRFPHRNAALGRESTPEERVFLTQPGSSF
jgi:uncharacterized protein (DUF924 family)